MTSYAIADIGGLAPLAWVLEETRKSIEASSKSLKRFARETELARGGEMSGVDAGQIRSARQQIHQVYGALEMVGQETAASLVQSMETAIQQFVLNPVKCNDAAATALERAGFAVIEFLESQLSEHPRSAIGLFPQYAEILELAGAERIHPADLWPVAWYWADPAANVAVQRMDYGREVRQQFDQRMLKIMREGDPNAASELRLICLGLAEGEATRQPAVFWRLAAGFFEAFEYSLIALDPYTRRAVSQILLQYNSLARGDQAVPERLAQDLLFFCAQAQPEFPMQAPALEAVRKAWMLDAYAHASYREPMFGLYDPSVLAQARRRVEVLKDNWSALAGGDLTRLKGCIEQFHLTAESLEKLHQRSRPLATALIHVADHIAQTEQSPDPELAMETATALLFLEASYAEFRPGDALFSERMLALASRLTDVCQGGVPQPLEPWMEELYRQFSERQTMGTVIGELRVTLGEVEQQLDRFFRQPSDTTPLELAPGLMSQMRGVLSVLGLDHAAMAVGQMRLTIERIVSRQLTIEQARSEGEFDKLGNSIGALGFLIDMLAYQPVLAKKLFAYDEESGQLKPLMERSGNTAAVAQAVVENSVDIGLDLDFEPEEPDALSSDELQDFATSTLPPSDENPGFLAANATDSASPSLQFPQEWLSVVSEDSAAEVTVPAEIDLEPESGQDLSFDGEDDIRSIFLEEARDVIQAGSAALTALDTDPSNSDGLATLRRAFHTLKGSSRMVGLTEFGDAAWSMEQLLNEWVADQKPATQDLREFSEEAIQAFKGWVDDIHAGNDRRWHAAPFSLAADALRTQGLRLPLLLDANDAFQASGSDLLFEIDTSSAALEPFDSPSQDGFADSAHVIETQPAVMGLMGAVAQPAAGSPVPVELRLISGGTNAEPDAEPDAEEFCAPTQPFEYDPGTQEFDLQLAFGDASDWEDEPVSQGGIDLDLSLDFDDFLALAADDSEAQTEAVPAALMSFPDAHAAAGLEADAGAAEDASFEADADAWPEAREDVSAPAIAVEQIEMPVSAEAPVQESAEVDEDLTGDYKLIGDLRISIPLYNVYLNEADEWSRALITELSEWSLELQRPVSEAAVSSAHSLAGSSATVGFRDLSELARAVEHALQRIRGQAEGTPEQATVLEAAAEEVRRLLHQFAAGILKKPDLALLQAVRELEPTDGEFEPSAPEIDAEDEINEAPDSVPVAASVTIADAPAYAIADGIDLIDAVDEDLLPIFLEEAEELLPRISAELRHWIAHPENQTSRVQVLRGLHTLKGSARLAGAMRLGEVAHRTESAIELLGTESLTRTDLEPLLDYADELQLGLQRLLDTETEIVARDASAIVHEDSMLDELLQGAILDANDAPVAAPPVGHSEKRAEIAPPAELSLLNSRVAASQMVRVRSHLLDRLLNRAGEIITSRTRLDSEVGQMRSLLGDLTGNLDRLRAQLRDVELQAEMQMQSRLALAKDAQQNFDPLEFDRFTRMQELTRMMAESVNDVATVQRSLQMTIEAAEDALASQGRQSRELQRDLLRTHMVEFEAISERLYRAVRQASKELGKRVRLEITGGSFEMDRGILDRMTPSFEHLLRNCVVHGIESAEARQALGKSPEGVISIEVQQAGNDVSVEFRDDGAGLDVARIRDRAIQTGLTTADSELTDSELGDLIFEAGFTTASEVTELAGRGIGMDVVRNEIQALGGRIETSSQAQQGTSFRLVMPLTTAVTHVLMIRSGKMVIGVPSNLVEQVQRVNTQELEAAYRSGHYRHGEQDLPFYWSGALLQNSQRSSEPVAKAASVVVFRSAEQRLAMHVDEVLGNQEVVVKKLGPQLSRLPGLAAITALPSGAVALIYNPVALAAVYGDQALAFGSMDASTAALTATPGDVDGAGTVENKPPLVLVVDDSITMRRVTQRLLQREGYRVALAADGLQGLERLQAERPSVVLSDIEMPRMDGFDFVRNIRGDSDLHDLPVIMITSRIAEKHREHARELGVNHYLGKPYSEEELLRLVGQYAGSALLAE